MPPKVERCVESLLKRKTFKPKASKKERESSAWAICQAAQKNSNEYLAEMISELPLDIDITLSEDGTFELSEVEGVKLDEADLIESLGEASDSKVCTKPDREEGEQTFCTFSEVNLAHHDKDKKGEMEDDGLLELEVLREGKFEHPWFGPLDFNKKYFMSVIQNFLNDTIMREVSFDSTHRPTEGATAWVKKLGIKRRMFSGNGARKIKHVLTSAVDLTDWGRSLVEGKQFKYFSSEVDHNYIDRETKEEYGPTMLGGGLTNRPFITGMLAVQMSDDAPTTSDEVANTEPGGVNLSDGAEDGQFNNQEEVPPKPSEDEGQAQLDESRNTNIEVAAKENQERPPESKLPDTAANSKNADAQPHHRALASEPTENRGKEESSTDEGVRNMEKLQEKIAALEARIASLDDKDSADAVALQEALDLLKEQMEAIPAKLEEAKKEVATELQSKFDDQSEKLQTLEAQVQTFEDERQKRDINDRCDALIRDGHYPAAVDKLRDIALSMDGETTIKLSEEGGEKTVSFVDAVSQIFGALPTEAKVDESTNLSNDTGSDDDTPPAEEKPNVVELGGVKVDLLDPERLGKLMDKVSDKKPVQ